MITPSRISFAEALRFWFRLGFVSFGGPAGQIAIIASWLKPITGFRKNVFCTR